MSYENFRDILKKLKVNFVSNYFEVIDHETTHRADYNIPHTVIFNKRFICNNKNKDYLICHYKTKVFNDDIEPKIACDFRQRHETIFHVEYEKHEITIQINNYISNNPKILSPIIHIGIYKDNIAYLKHISYFENHMFSFFNYTNEGIDLFETCIEFLKEKKDELNIKEIQVCDNSNIFINKNLIQLSHYYVLLYGERFYSKYGFVPINKYGDMTHPNTKKITNMKISNTTLFKYIFKVIKNKKNRIDFYNKFSNLTINEFFNKFHDECFIENNKYRYDFLLDFRLQNLENQWMKLDLN